MDGERVLKKGVFGVRVVNADGSAYYSVQPAARELVLVDGRVVMYDLIRGYTGGE